MANEILALCGSLRRESKNLTLLRALQLVDDRVAIYDELGALPHLNPDVEEGDCPDVGTRLRDRVRGSAAVIVCSPEYAHGVPGAMKNALDWLVGSDAPLGKPAAVINASARSTIADAQIRETMRTMGFRIIDAASITVSLDGRKPTAEEIAQEPALRLAMAALV